MPIGAPPPPGSSAPTRYGTGPAATASRGAVIVGQVMAGTASNPAPNPQQFPAVPVAEDVVIEALSTNVASVWLGTSQAAQPWEIRTNGFVVVDPDNLDELWLRGANTTDGVAYLGK